MHFVHFRAGSVHKNWYSISMAGLLPPGPLQDEWWCWLVLSADVRPADENFLIPKQIFSLSHWLVGSLASVSVVFTIAIFSPNVLRQLANPVAHKVPILQFLTGENDIGLLAPFPLLICCIVSDEVVIYPRRWDGGVMDSSNSVSRLDSDRWVLVLNSDFLSSFLFSFFLPDFFLLLPWLADDDDEVGAPVADEDEEDGEECLLSLSPSRPCPPGRYSLCTGLLDMLPFSTPYLIGVGGEHDGGDAVDGVPPSVSVPRNVELPGPEPWVGVHGLVPVPLLPAPLLSPLPPMDIRPGCGVPS